MKKMLAALAFAGALVAAAPALAVNIVSQSAGGGNTVDPVELSGSQVSVDFDLYSFSPTSVVFGVQAGDAASYSFDSSIDIFTGSTLPSGSVRRLTFGLTNGATFGLGTVSAAFSTATTSLNAAGNELTIAFAPGENFNVLLGSLDDTVGDFVINRNGLAEGGSFALNINAAVPEPATWAMMIGGFGLVGGTLRRRRIGTLATA